MTREELIEYSKGIHDKMLITLAAKNADYAGASSEDPFFNFTRVEAMNIASAEVGFMTRMTDKMSRLSTFVKKGVLTVADESVEDTLVDLANYAILMAAYIRDKRNQNQKSPAQKIIDRVEQINCRCAPPPLRPSSNPARRR